MAASQPEINMWGALNIWEFSKRRGKNSTWETCYNESVGNEHFQSLFSLKGKWMNDCVPLWYTRWTARSHVWFCSRTRWYSLDPSWRNSTSSVTYSDTSAINEAGLYHIAVHCDNTYSLSRFLIILNDLIVKISTLYDLNRKLLTWWGTPDVKSMRGKVWILKSLIKIRKIEENQRRVFFGERTW